MSRQELGRIRFRLSVHRGKLSILAFVALLLALFLLAGCGGSKRSAAGTYQYDAIPGFQLELKKNGEFRLTGPEPYQWDDGWLGLPYFTSPQEGTWLLEKDDSIVLRSGGSQKHFGKLQDHEIVDIYDYIWSKE